MTISLKMENSTILALLASVGSGGYFPDFRLALYHCLQLIIAAKASVC
jgi:hypothetical protein